MRYKNILQAVTLGVSIFGFGMWQLPGGAYDAQHVVPWCWISVFLSFLCLMLLEESSSEDNTQERVDQ